MTMDIEKTIRSYAKIYRKALVEGKIKDVDDEITSYEKRLREGMCYSSGIRIYQTEIAVMMRSLING